MNLLIIGHGGHGKDTFAEMLNEIYGLSYISSSQAAADIFICEQLKGKYGYKTSEECYADRVNHRAEWYDLIVEYNTPDKARLAKEIMKVSDIYVGMRNDHELECCLTDHVFDVVIGVFNPRVPEEPSDSFNIDFWGKCDIVVPNSGTKQDLRDKAMSLRLLKNLNIL
jgi:hypothetical protein